MRRVLLVLAYAFTLSACAPAGPFISAEGQYVLDAAWIRGAYQGCRSIVDRFGIPDTDVQTPEAKHSWCKLRTRATWNETHQGAPHPLPAVDRSST